MNQLIEQDAIEYGKHVKQGGWRLGLLVARNVEKGQNDAKFGSKTPASGDNSNRKDRKVSATEFGKLSKTSAARVLRHLDAWDKAAEAGHVPVADKLVPGSEVKLDADKLPEWGEFYTAVSGGYNGGSDRTPSKKDARKTLAKLSSADRASVVAEAVANDKEAAEAVADNAVAQARVAVAGEKKKKKAREKVAARRFADESGSPGIGAMRFSARVGELLTQVRLLTSDYQEILAANPELEEHLNERVSILKGDIIIALDTLVGDGVDAALAEILRAEEAGL